MSRVSTIAWRVLGFIIGAVFIYAGIIKLLDPVGFGNDIDNYKMFPWMISVRLAFFLPWLEIFGGLAVIFRKLYLGGLSILLGLTGIFIAASLAARARGLDITCGCFGHASKNWSFTQHIMLDLLLLVALSVLFLNCRTQSER